MGLVAQWNGHRFEVSPDAIRSFNNLQISGSCKTDTQTKSFTIVVPDGNNKSKTKKVTKNNVVSVFKETVPIELSFTALLHSMLGCDVRNEALAFINDAESGAADYFYLGGHKIASCTFLITKANVKEVNISENGWWMSAAVEISMTQASTFDQQTGVAIASVPTSIAAAASTTRFLTKASVRASSTTANSGGAESVSDGIAAANSVIAAGKSAS